MATSKLDRYWTLITILLVVVIITGGVVAWLRFSPSEPLEISVAKSSSHLSRIYIGGAVATPGFYPLDAEDRIQDIIQAAGGASDNANLNWLKLYIPRIGEESQPQKIDLNRAEAWLLEALPGISKVRAQAIIDYRNQKPFHSTSELLKVAGIGTATYEQIEHLVTVSD